MYVCGEKAAEGVFACIKNRFSATRHHLPLNKTTVRQPVETQNLASLLSLLSDLQSSPLL